MKILTDWFTSIWKIVIKKFKFMKVRILLSAVAMATLLVSCGENTNKNTTEARGEVIDNQSVTNKTVTTSEQEKEEETASEKVDTAKFDKMLDEYEAYVTKYIDFAKRAKAGDMSIMTEYTSLMEKAEDFNKAMKEVENSNQVTPEQLERMLKIQTKFSKEALSM